MRVCKDEERAEKERQKMEERKNLDIEGLKALAKSKYDKARELWDNCGYKAAFDAMNELIGELGALESMELYETVALDRLRLYRKCTSDGADADIDLYYSYARELMKSKNDKTRASAHEGYVAVLRSKGLHEEAVDYLFNIKEEFAVRGIVSIAMTADEEEKLKIYKRLWDELDKEENDVEYKKHVCMLGYQGIMTNRGLNVSDKKLIDVKSEKDSRDVIAYRFLDRRSEYTGINELGTDAIVYYEVLSKSPDSYEFLQDLVAKNLLGAYISLGYKHMKGNGCEQDYAKAKEYFVKATEGYTKQAALKGIEELHEQILREEKLKF